MAKFRPGQRVAIAFNAQSPDPRVPQQSAPWTDQKGRRWPASPGIGKYQTKPEQATVLEVMENESGVQYLCDVELFQEHTRNGKPYTVPSIRKRIVPEAKLTPLE